MDDVRFRMEVWNVEEHISLFDPVLPFGDLIQKYIGKTKWITVKHKLLQELISQRNIWHSFMQATLDLWRIQPCVVTGETELGGSYEIALLKKWIVQDSVYVSRWQK